MGRNVNVVVFAPFAMQMFLLSMAIASDPTPFKLGIVNEEVSYTNMSYQDCSYPIGCKFGRLSCRYLDNLNDTVVKVYYPDTTSARDAIKAGDVWGVLYFTDNFTDDLVAQITLGNKDIVHKFNIMVWVDDQEHAALLQKYLQLASWPFVQNILQSCERDENNTQIPMLLNQAIYVPKVLNVSFTPIMLDPTAITLAIVNQEVNYVNMSYQNCSHPIDKCKFSRLSCRYLDNINDTIVKLYYPDLPSAINAIKAGDVSGVLYFRDNFTDALVARLALGADADKETLDQSEIRVWLDTPYQERDVLLQKDLQLSNQRFVQDLLQSCYQDENKTQIPMLLKEPISVSNVSNEVSFTRIVRDQIAVTVAIVNKEVNYVNASYQNCSYPIGCNLTKLSCLLLNYLDDTIVKVYYPDLTSATDAIKAGDVWGVLYFTDEFSKGFAAQMAIGNKDTDYQLEIQYWTGTLHQDSDALVYKYVQLATQLFDQNIRKSCNLDKNNTQIQMSLMKPIDVSNVSNVSFTPTVSNPTTMILAIVNQEVDYVSMFYQDCSYPIGCKLSKLSCRYLDNLSDTIVKVYYPDPTSATDAIKAGDVLGALYFTDNFTDAFVARLAFGADADEETVDQSEIRFWLDASDQERSVLVQNDLQLSNQRFVQNLLRSCGRDENNTQIPMLLKEPIYVSNVSNELIVRNQTSMTFAIVNQEVNYVNMSYQNCSYLMGCKFNRLSCRYLDYLNDTIVKVYYPDPISATDAIKAGDVWGALYFTDNFTDALVARLALGVDADEETLYQSEIRFWLDTSHQDSDALVQKYLQLSSKRFVQDLLQSCDQDENNIPIPMLLNEPIYVSNMSNELSFTPIVRDPPATLLAIVNQEVDYINMFYQDCSYPIGCKFSKLSCRYLDNLNNTIVKVYYPDPTSATDAIKAGDVWGALYFTDNFTNALVARMALGADADKETVDQSQIQLWLGMPNQQNIVNLQRNLELANQVFAQNFLKSCHQNNSTQIPISFKETIYVGRDVI